MSACHVDHGLRPESGADGIACATLASRLDVPFRSAAVGVEPGAGVQAAARRARYAALREAARAAGAERIATGHHRQDQAETVLHRLLRGAGARGLAGIPPRSGDLVRPLIDRSRGEVVDYLGARGLPWREDPSNASPRYLRNRLRHEVLPVLEALAPGLEERLCRTADLLRADDRALEALAAPLTPDGASALSLASLREAPEAVRARAVRRAWRAAAGREADLSAGHATAILAICAARRAGPVALPGGLEARVVGGLLSIGPAPAAPAGRRPSARPAARLPALRVGAGSQGRRACGETATGRVSCYSFVTGEVGPCGPALE